VRRASGNCPHRRVRSGRADYNYSYRSRRNRYWNYQEGDEEDNDEDESFTVATVDDSWQYVDEWRDIDDRVVEFGRIPLTGGELLPTGALDAEPPDEKRLTEASGNEGATYERSYHRAALVLWLQNRSVDVLLQAGVVAVCLTQSSWQPVASMRGQRRSRSRNEYWKHGLEIHNGHAVTRLIDNGQGRLNGFR
jgi:hypothetical protein